MQGLAGSATSAIGNIVGSRRMQDYGNEVADRNFAEARDAGRPDLDVPFWREGGVGWGGAPAWVAYQTAKQAPQIGAALAVGAALPAAAVPAGLARFGATLPGVMGGGAARAGMSVAQRRGAIETGRNFARAAVGGTVVGAPIGLGSMYDEARERGDETRGDALKAAALAIPYGALAAFQPAQFRGILERGLQGNIARRIATAGAVGAAAEIPQEGMQRALELTFRPDIAPRDKMREIVDAALTGGAVGGAVGGMSGVRRLASQEPGAVENDDLKTAVDDTLTGTLMLPPPPSPQPMLPGMEDGRITRPAAAQPAPVEPVPPTPFAGEPTEVLQQAVESIVRKGGPASAEEMQVAQTIEQELARRNVEPFLPGMDAAPGAPRAPIQTPAGPVAVDTPAVAPDVAPVDPQVAETRALAKDLAGPRARGKFFDNLQAQDTEGLVEALITELDAGNSTTSVMTLAENLGVVGDRAAALREAETRAEQLTRAANREAATPEQVEAANQANRDANALRARNAIVERVEARRAQEAAAQQAGDVDAATVDTAPVAAVPATQAVPVPVEATPQPVTPAQPQAQPAQAVEQPQIQSPAQPTPGPAQLQTPTQAQPAQPAQADAQPQIAQPAQGVAQPAQQLFRAGPVAAPDGFMYLADSEAPAQGGAGLDVTPVQAQFSNLLDTTRAEVGNVLGTPPQGYAGTTDRFYADRAREMGYDGIRFRRNERGAKPWSEYLVVNPETVTAPAPTTPPRTQAEAEARRAPKKAAPKKAAPKKTPPKKTPPKTQKEAEAAKPAPKPVEAKKPDAKPVKPKKAPPKTQKEAEAAKAEAAPVREADKPKTDAEVRRIMRAQIQRQREQRQQVMASERQLQDFFIPGDVVKLGASTFLVESYTTVPGKPLPEVKMQQVRMTPAGWVPVPGAKAQALAVRPEASMIQSRPVGRVDLKTGKTVPVKAIKPREADAPAGAVALADVRRDVARLTSGWTGGIEVVTVQSVADLPVETAGRVRRDNGTEAFGFVDSDGRVYLIADNLPSREAGAATLYHEALGHVGLARQFRGRLDAALMEIHKSSLAVRVEAEAWLARNPDAYRGENRTVRAVEEVLARRSEGGPIEASLLDKIVAIVKEYGRRIGITTEMSAREVNAVLAMAHAKAMRGGIVDRTVRSHRYMYVGERSVVDQDGNPTDRAREYSQRVAQDMEAQGLPSETIRHATGWFRNPYDGKWRYEITDERASLKDWGAIPESGIGSREATPLEQVLDHDELFQSYPHLRQLPVRKQPAEKDFTKSMEGWYNPVEDSVTITPYALDPLSTLLHEVQHAIQIYEGFARGSAPDIIMNDLSKAQRESYRDFVLQEIGDKIVEAQQLRDLAEKAKEVTSGVEFARRHNAYYAAAVARNTPGDTQEARRTRLEIGKLLSTARFRLARELFDGREMNELSSTEFEALMTIGEAIAKGGGIRNKFLNEIITRLDRRVAAFEDAKIDIALDNVDALRRYAKVSGDLYALYRQSAGEIEARDAEARSRMTERQRAQQAPLTSERIDASQAIVNFDVPTAPTASTLRPPRTDAALRNRMDQMTSAVRNVTPQTAAKMKPALRRSLLSWSSLQNIDGLFGRMFTATGQSVASNPIKKLYDTYRQRVAISQLISQQALKPYNEYRALPAKAQEKVRYIMGMTQYGADPNPAKTWAKDHKHLHDHPQAEKIKRDIALANKYWNELRQTKHLQVYRDLVAVNEAIYHAQHAQTIFNLINANSALVSQIQGATRDPMKAFMRQPSLHLSPAQTRDFWAKEAKRLIDSVEAFTMAQRGASKMPAAEYARIEKHASLLEAKIADVRQQREAMARAPYFHLGRTGDHYVAFSVRSTERVTKDAKGKEHKSKVPDAQALEAVSKALDEAGFKGIEVNPAAEKANVFIRVENETTREALFKIVQGLKRKGLLDPEVAPTRAQREGSDMPGISEQQVTQLTAYADSHPAFIPDDGMTPAQKTELSAAKNRMLGILREYYLNALPDSASAKVMTHRDYVPGFSDDHMRSYAFRTELAANSLANLAIAPGVMQSFTEMRSAINDAKTSTTHADVSAMQDVQSEILTREAQRPTRPPYNWVDALRAYNHAYFLGMSPAYVMINTTQIGVLLWPELAKKHGFVKSAKAIAKVTPNAFKVLRAAIAQGIGMGRGADAPITEASLQATGLDAATQEFVMELVVTGAVDIGSASREHGRVVENKVDSPQERMLRWAGAAGFYSEVLARLVAGLAARELSDPKMSREARNQYAVQTIDQSMFNYSPGFIGRMTGKQGVLGQATPLSFSFLQYSFQLTEKLTRELHTAFMADARSPAERAEAKRFLAGHITAIGVLAGSLGLPMATVFARVIETMVETFSEGDEPYDVEAAWRNFLAGIFGKDMAEILARGAPRAINLDLSSRAGEQNIIPFSRVLADRREWDDKMETMALDAAGSPVSMLMSVIKGGTEISRGNVLGGMKEMMPVGIKSPLEAYRMTSDGYVDTRGNVLPMTPEAKDILAQLLGFAPRELAEYREARFTQAQRRGILSRTASNIRNNLARAYDVQDADEMRKWYGRAQEFDRDNPTYAVLPRFGSTVQQRQRARALAESTGTPLGTDLRDTKGARLTDYANF